MDLGLGNNQQTFLMVAIPIFLAMAGVIILFVVINHRRHLRQQVDFEKEMLRSQIEIQELTFSHIGREIHDNIGQLLSVAKLYLANLPLKDENEKEVRIKETHDLIGKAIADLRNLSKSLNHEALLGMSLEVALAEELNRVENSGKFLIHFESTGQAIPLPERTKTMLFRMCQELIGNAIKHSQAKSLSLKLNWNGKLEIRIKDDGKGLPLPNDNGHGQGLINLKKRAELIGGKIEFISAPGKGTEAIILIAIQHTNIL